MRVGLYFDMRNPPAWAVKDGSTPKNLALPWNDPANYWGQFVYKLAQTYAGKIDTWITFAKGRVAKLRLDHNRDGQDDDAGEHDPLAPPEQRQVLAKVGLRRLLSAQRGLGAHCDPLSMGWPHIMTARPSRPGDSVRTVVASIGGIG